VGRLLNVGAEGGDVLRKLVDVDVDVDVEVEVGFTL
jgi:hypothetical protein